jgi:hypothetical protein
LNLSAENLFPPKGYKTRRAEISALLVLYYNGKCF